MKTLFPPIEAYLAQLSPNNITEKRKEKLNMISEYIYKKLKQQEPVALNFICTHNSRRSFLTNVWANVLAYHFKLPLIESYSAGTEATEIFSSCLEVLEENGFQISRKSKTPVNPTYEIKFSEAAKKITDYSKSLAQQQLNQEFIAILTCDEANQACPMVPRAEIRFALPYQDPKAFDKLPNQKEAYRATNTQIATELLYLFNALAKIA